MGLLYIIGSPEEQMSMSLDPRSCYILRTARSSSANHDRARLISQVDTQVDTRVHPPAYQR
jgi:hypothetical protein